MFGVIVGALSGLLVAVYGTDWQPLIVVPAFAVTGGVLAAAFGPRALHFLR